MSSPSKDPTPSWTLSAKLTPAEYKGMLDKASCLLRDSGPQQALELLESAVQIQPDNARAHHLHSIALAKVGKIDQAVKAVGRAFELAPGSILVNYNRAVLLAISGDHAAALRIVQEIVQQAPKYAPAKLVLQKLQSAESLGAVHLEPGPVHTVPALGENSEAWTTIGWTIAGIGIVLFFLRLGLQPISIEPVAGGRSIFEGLTLKADPLSVAIIYGSVVSIFLTFGWMAVDMVDRRSRMMWVIPVLACCFCGGMPMIPQCIYMIVGRR